MTRITSVVQSKHHMQGVILLVWVAAKIQTQIQTYLPKDQNCPEKTYTRLLCVSSDYTMAVTCTHEGQVG